MPGLEERFRSFGWRALAVDGIGYEGMLGALEDFGSSAGKVSLWLSLSIPQGWGGCSSFMVGHKVELPERSAEQELPSFISGSAGRIGWLISSVLLPAGWTTIAPHWVPAPNA